MIKGLKFLAALAVPACLIIYSSCNSNQSGEGDKTADTTAAAPAVDSVKLSVERGSYLVNSVTICLDCHSERNFKKFAGPLFPGTEGKGGERFGPEFGLPGEVFAKNITPSAIGDWTDAELIRAITQGVNKKGDTLFPLMPYMHYARMAEQDIKDIVAYIRTLKPIDNKVPDRKLFIPIAAAVPPLPNGQLSQSKPAPSDLVKYGEYLVNSAACSDCHTPQVKGQFDFSKAFAGGHSFKTPGFTVVTPNITPDSATGIGTWTEQMFLEKFRTNSAKENLEKEPGKFNTIMPWSVYGQMKEEDLKAIFAYLKTIKPVKSKIEKWPRL
jgi:mono/diheme cytochrome c family protein